MIKTKLHYQFHNPNAAAASADCLLRLLIEANAAKVENILRDAMSTGVVENKTKQDKKRDAQ